MTPAQIKLVQFAKRELGLEDLMYREILRRIGDVGGYRPSTKDLTNAGFERVMAFLEGRGFRHAGHAETYWRDRAAGRDHFASTQQVHLIRQLSAEVQRYPLVSLCLRVSKGRVETESKLTPREAWDLIEMLKSAVKREAGQSEGIHHATQADAR